jgi:PilZ domain-containing protein
MILSPSAETSTQTAEHRRSPRIEILGHVQGRLEASGVSARVLDVNISGFGLLTSRPFTIGSTHRFRFTLPDGVTALLTATAVHCDRRPTRDGSDLYLAGFRFVEKPERGGDTTAGDLLDKIRSVMSFDIP